MIVTPASDGRLALCCLALIAATGLACGSGATSGTPGTGGGSGSAGSGGSAGTTGAGGGAGTTGPAGAGGSASGSAGTTAGSGGSASGAAGTTGSAGASGTAGAGVGGAGGAGATGGRGGTSGNSGSAGATGTAGAAGGRGGTTGSAGSGGTTGTAGAAGGAMPSAGCTSAGGAPASGRYTIDASGTMREYIIKMPAGYDPHRPYRLIFASHGAQYDAASVDAGGAPSKEGPYFGIEPMAGGGAIFVATQALQSGWRNANDIPYFNAMIARFEAQLCIDQSRIFGTGFSMGAIETITIACAQGDTFRAIAPMSGEIMGTCSSTNPLAYWGSHGTNDPTIPIAMGRAARDAFRMRNHCTTQTVAGSISGCVNYQGCDPGKPVSWCEFAGVHEPPAFSGEGIWGFFSQF
jgi:poly(3-hydroxybutyrate) depolymerase